MHAPPDQLGPATFRHDLVLYSSAEELAAVAVPFLRAGLEAGAVAVITTSDPSAAILRDALGDDERVHVLPRGEVYRDRTPAAITAFRRLAERVTGHGHTQLRVVGETYFGRTPREWLEWQRYEAVLNEAMRSWPTWGLCAYDLRQLPDELIDSGLRTHPHLVDAGGRRPNPHFTEPADYLRALPVPDEPLEATEPLLQVDNAKDFAGLRHAVGARLTQLHGSRDALEDLHLAIDEMSANAVRHGGPPVQLRLWASADRVVCRISDGGAGMDDPFAGYGPAHGDDLSHGGMGLWLARQLCDHVDVVDGPNGLSVRLTTLLR
ncbi:sensor histidine kinase [Modestobacter sp. VKM Ac-2984]|uniref:sensor histidine kinase n=1 Tax=Modestobacter sp. VKM Ac-2984 TaxID=3004138 RepID=UPI0022AA09BB|nr:sensor histidine kinase [Modestobacter sp. VKM Ac-2984]MCZ2815199.1 sensor histidine kinase [Modestobacter sp. VKM Ac-2984]